MVKPPCFSWWNHHFFALKKHSDSLGWFTLLEHISCLKQIPYVLTKDSRFLSLSQCVFRSYAVKTVAYRIISYQMFFVYPRILYSLDSIEYLIHNTFKTEKQNYNLWFHDVILEYHRLSSSPINLYRKDIHNRSLANITMHSKHWLK